MKDNTLFVEVQRARDTFKKKVDEAYKKREDDLKSANMKHIGGYLNEVRASIRDDYNKSVRKAGKEFSATIDPIIAEYEQKAKARLTNIKPELLSQIKAIEDLPISADELNVIGQKYSGDYWASQRIRQIALRNGIAKTDVNFQCEPDFATEMKVIEDLKTECTELLTEYDGSGELSHRNILTNRKLLRWEMRATNGLIDESEMPDSMLVDRAFTRIATQPDELARGQQIGTELKNIRESARTELIAKIADSRILGETALRFSGFGDELLQFRKENTSERLEDARRALQTVSEALEQNTFSGILKLDDARADAKREGNPYFETLVSSTAETNEKLKDAAMIVDDVRNTNLSGKS